MGMDLYGNAPQNKTGEYLRYSVWGWHPLALYILETAPQELTGKCQYWQSNDGDGLGADDSRALAEFLSSEIDSGRAEAYVEMRKATLESLPDQACKLCQGTGVRDDQYLKGTCNLCHGKGKVRSPESWYPLEIEDIEDFRDFLMVCGGFKIY